MYLQFVAIVSTYFVKFRGFANSASQSGVSIGGLVMPPFLTYLFQQYGYTSTYVLIAAFHFNVAVFGSFLWPISFFKRKSHVKKEQMQPLIVVKGDKPDIMDTKNGTVDTQLSRKLTQDNHNVYTRQTSDLPMHPVTRIRREIDTRIHEPRPRSALFLALSNSSLFTSPVARYASTDLISSSLLDVTQHRTRDIDTTNNPKEPKQSRNVVKRILLKVFDVRLLTKMEFLYYLACNFFLCAGSATCTLFLPQLCKDHNISLQTAAWIVAGTNVLELISRFVFGYISDKKWCHRSTILSLASIIIGIAAQSSYMLTSLSTIIMYSIVAGFLQGVYFSLYATVILDILEMEEYKVT